jgi:hypothetical protein
MARFLKWLSTHKFEVHTLAFLMMVLPPVPLYIAAQRGAELWIWALMAPVVAANILVLLVH